MFIKSYGCQMNVYDATRMADVLAPEGFVETAEMESADLVILNTCHIREKAAEKVYSELGRVREVKEPGGHWPRGEGGCGRLCGAGGGQGDHRPRAGGRSCDRAAELSPFAGSSGEGEGPQRVVDTEFPAEDKFDHLPMPDREASRLRGPTAFVTVQEGCDKFCTFCVVPYTRGAEVSRPAAKILAEIEKLAAQGVVEFTLLGQNVNAYHGEGPDGRDWTLARLLHAAAEVPGVKRLRYTTSHPRDMGDDLIAAHRDLSALMPYLHLPVQSGSDRILAAMNRKHDGDAYRRIIDKVRAARPDIALSSDFIVGFPGESDADLLTPCG